MIEMDLLGVQVEMPSETPLMLLRESDGDGRILPVVIDTPEAHAIYRGMEDIQVPRPLSHDLMTILLDTLGAKLEKVTITAIRERTFFAELEISQRDKTHVISARPSDAIALAVRTKAPIFASEEVLTEAGQIIQIAVDSEDEDPDILLADFQEFLEDLEPADFSVPEAEADSDSEAEAEAEPVSDEAGGQAKQDDGVEGDEQKEGDDGEESGAN